MTSLDPLEKIKHLDNGSSERFFINFKPITVVNIIVWISVVSAVIFSDFVKASNLGFTALEHSIQNSDISTIHPRINYNIINSSEFIFSVEPLQNGVNESLPVFSDQEMSSSEESEYAANNYRCQVGDDGNVYLYDESLLNLQGYLVVINCLLFIPLIPLVFMQIKDLFIKAPPYKPILIGQKNDDEDL